ncbi:hypothetical protein IV203_010523 [Nitzschia inconspicua]|uniref:Uncharacterized protein n=1 Tax=Nitzschia inconspicua TaxID=303405 RepID=A0A9K3PKZ0_9STRA|nr:hypothetical protein IV203_010523 [Nitzschia inconspicua]
MGRYVFDPRHDDDDNNSSASPTPRNEYADDDDQSREEGEIIEDDDDDESRHFSDRHPTTTTESSSFFSFPRFWRSQPKSVEEQRYTLFASSDYNNVSDDENDGDEDDGREKENSQYDPHYRRFDTTLSNRDCQHQDQLDESIQQHQQGIHYHIYIPESQSARWLARLHGEPSEDSPVVDERSRTMPWKWITVLALFTHILYWYGPSVPPPPSPSTSWQSPNLDSPSLVTTTSWNDYWHQQGQVVYHVSRDWMLLCYHVTYWSLHGLRQDWGRRWEIWVDRSKYNINDSVFRWQFPATWDFQRQATIPSSRNTIQIFGQDAAMERIERSLNSWQASHHHKTSPLFLYVTGGTAVGKQSIAYNLLQQMRPSDANSYTIDVDCRDEFSAITGNRLPHLQDENDGRYVHCPLVRLTPEDVRRIISSGDTTNTYQQLHSHVVQHPHSILLLQHVDEYPQQEFSELLEYVKSHPLTFGSTVVVMTSHIGTTTIDKWMRKHMQLRQDYSLNQLPVEGETMLRYEIQQHHQGGNGDGTRTTNMFDLALQMVVIPMISLDTNVMTDIVGHLAMKGIPSAMVNDTEVTSSQLQLTSSAAEHILDALEWHQWIHKTTGITLRSWSPAGARPLIQLWDERIFPAVERLLERPECTPDPISVAKETVLLLDYDFASEHFLLKSCRQITKETEGGGTEFNLLHTLHGTAVSCGDGSHSNCRFYL